MERHPTDVRSLTALSDQEPVHEWFLKRLWAQEIPVAALQHVLSADPAKVVLTPDPGLGLPPVLTVDLAGHLVARSITAVAERPDLVNEWIASLPTPAAERFVHSLALNTKLTPRYSKGEFIDSRPYKQIFDNPKCFLALPGLYRATGSDFLPDLELLTPAITRQLRNADWRDCAGRGIDAFLIGGAWGASQEVLQPGLGETVLAAAIKLDARHPGYPLSLTSLLQDAGIILSPEHLEALQSAQQSIVRNGMRLEDRMSIRPLLFPPDASASGPASFPELIGLCMDLNRANRAAAYDQQTGPHLAQEPPQPAPTL